MNKKFVPVIGLEVHVELKTKSKMFCGCSTEFFGHEPNTHTCPVCLGLPGALPVPNRKAIEWSVLIGMALNCKIPMISKFDRKNYFYPDLAKGYQISQYDQPFSENGFIVLNSGKKIGIRRAHMEEDTGKLIHAMVEGEKVSLIDFNRSGVPLVEIVTEPDFESAVEVKEYLQKLQQIVRYLDVANADMEKGEMRLEPNISLWESKGSAKRKENDLPKYKVEVKNINSFKFVEKAVNFEVKRQAEILEKGEIPDQETRGWDENKQKTFSQRKKEDAQDYRYFPEPDIPPIKWTTTLIEKIRLAMPELPDEKVKRFTQSHALPYYDAEILTRERGLADYFEEAVAHYGERSGAKKIANWIINKKVETGTVNSQDLVKQIKSSQINEVLDKKVLQKIIDEVIMENNQAVEDYKKGKSASIMFLLGQSMRKIGKKVDANKVKYEIEHKLKKND